MTASRPYTERMSRILADAKPAPPRVGCILLRCRLGARGRDGASLPLTEAERRALVEELSVFAGPVASETPEPGVFFIDPSAMSRTIGGVDAWARCVKGYLNARGFSASVGVAADAETALAAARSRWGIAVVHVSDPPPAPSWASTTTPHARPAATPPKAQLGLPGLILGRPKRPRRAKPAAA